LDLLTDDIRELQSATNIFMEYGGLLNARTEIEFPRLEKVGQEIIALVRTEYRQ
jgi:hypothetical protein